MTDEELLSSDLQRTMRVMATIGGQIAERFARIRSDAARQQQLQAQERTRATADEARQLERRMQQDITAARTVYGGVRDPQFWRDDDRVQVRVGEALAVSEAMRPHDPLAGMSHDHLRREINSRHGDQAAAWMLAATAAYREELDRLHDRDTSNDEADRHTDRAETAATRAQDAEDERATAADKPQPISDEQLRAAAAEERASTKEETDLAGKDRAEAAHEDRSAEDAGQRGDHALGQSRTLRARDPQAAQAKDTTEHGYPIPDRDNINHRVRTRHRPARPTAKVGAEKATGR